MADSQNHEMLEFRRLVYRFSLKLTKEESKALVYIRLYDCKERYGNADTLEVLSKLETDCVFTPNNPEGLIEVAKDINRLDLQNMVKDFVKKRQRKAKANDKAARKTVPSFKTESPVSDEEELQLKAILEVTLSQAAVFVKQVDILQQAITSGTKEQRQKAAEAIGDAICTAEALTGRLKKARGELEHSNRNSMRSSSHSSGSGEEASEDYYNLRFGPPESSPQLVQAIGTGTETPTPMPRRLRVPIQESQNNPVQDPTGETCYPAKDAHHQQLVSPKTGRWTTVDSGSKPTQISPLQIKNSPRPKRPKPAVPPKPSRTATSVTKTSSTVECDNSGDDYTTLQPDIDGSTQTGTDDSGFEEWKQHKFQSPTQKDTEGAEVHYYKSLRRDEVIADEYQSLKR